MAGCSHCQRAIGIHKMLTENVLELLRTPLLLVLRLYFGYQIFLAGKGKLGRLDEVAGFFGNIGIPAPGVNAVLASVTECVGGLLLIAGLGSRLAAVPLTITMIVAYATAHREELNAIVSNPDTFMGAAPFHFLWAFLTILAFGPGLLSLDALIRRIVEKKAKGDGAA